MGNRSILMLVFAAALGLVAVFIAQFWLKENKPAMQSQKTASLTTVVVAKAPLFFGTTISAPQLKEVAWPTEAVPPGAFAKISDLIDPEAARVALRPIEINEPVLASKVSGKGGRLSMSGLIDKDKLAATIRVNDVVGVGGFVLPGDRVDVMVTREIGDDTYVNDVLIQNIKVVGVDQDANEARDKPEILKTVTVEVTREQAQKLALAQQVGSISLALRNLENSEKQPITTIRLADLRDNASGAVPKVSAPRVRSAAPVRKYRAKRAMQAAAPASPTVRVLRGFSESSYAVQHGAN
jgi:pilus assembly protein CpaB